LELPVLQDGLDHLKYRLGDAKLRQSLLRDKPHRPRKAQQPMARSPS
jgi:hypothetical protein